MPLVAVVVMLLFGAAALAGPTLLHGETLPDGAAIISRQAGLWETNQRTILIAGVLLVAQSLLIAGLLVQGQRRRKAERALRDRQGELTRSENRYKLATAAGSVGVWDWNFETGELFVDPGLKAILGFDDHDISNRPDDWGSRVHADDVPLASAGVQACLDGKSDSYEIEHRMLHKNGSVRWMLSRGTALRAVNGSLSRLVGTKVDITERKQAEEVIRESQAVLEISNQEIRQLAGRLISSQEVERARIARDLHDDLSQQIAGLSIALSALKRRITDVPNTAHVSVEVASLHHRVTGLADDIRRLSHDLHPSALQHAGLVAALAAHCAETQRQHHLQVHFTPIGDFESVPADAALCLYRVTQESVRNALTHARANRIDVTLTRTGTDAELMITDDGRGFDVAEARRQGRGLGLVSITERVRLVGGTVSIVTELARGTRVRVHLPAHGQMLEPLPM